MSVVKRIERWELLVAVERAVDELEVAEDRDAVREFARTTGHVVAGAWCVNGHRCPASAAGIDRLRLDAQAFARVFDRAMGAPRGTVLGLLYEVVE